MTDIIQLLLQIPLVGLSLTIVALTLSYMVLVEGRGIHPWIPPRTKALYIRSAKYGRNGQVVDVTDIVRSKILLEFEVTNHNLGGDPLEGTEKELKVVYSYAGETRTKRFRENQMLKLP